MFIDIHTHAFHPKIANKVLDQLEGHYGVHPAGDATAEDLIQRMERAGVDKSVVLMAATKPSQVIPANNWAIEMLKLHPEFIPFGTIHPGFDRMEAELDRLEKHGIKGLKFHPDFQGFRMDDPGLFEVMEMVGDRFICLFHVGDRLPPEQNPSCPCKMAALRKAFPAPTIIAAHMGGYHQWELAMEVLSGLDVYVDTSSTMDFVDDKMMQKLFNTFDKEKILFGSDYPLYDPGEEIGQLSARLGLSENDMERIMTNAETILSFTPPKDIHQLSIDSDRKIAV